MVYVWVLQWCLLHIDRRKGPTVQWDLTTKKVVGEIDIISDEENVKRK